ncbi:MAG TPA: type II toxin-antitoxin system prevent-host-death family antitoxin [Thermomicrobiales bacterium]|nr:type II toxin-antitoxin system prevent-host-death family antitoxin [Thermomicrobiales bacterium]
MSSVGVRELKEQTSEIVRRVREDGETIDITYRGEVVATIEPKRTLPPDEDRAFWEEQRALVRAIGERMGTKPVDAAALLDLERMEVSPDDEELPPMRPMNS